MRDRSRARGRCAPPIPQDQSPKCEETPATDPECLDERYLREIVSRKNQAEAGRGPASSKRDRVAALSRGVPEGSRADTGAADRGVRGSPPGELPECGGRDGEDQPARCGPQEEVRWVGGSRFRTRMESFWTSGSRPESAPTNREWAFPGFTPMATETTATPRKRRPRTGAAGPSKQYVIETLAEHYTMVLAKHR